MMKTVALNDRVGKVISTKNNQAKVLFYDNQETNIVAIDKIEERKEFKQEITLTNTLILELFGYGLWDVSNTHFRGNPDIGFLDLIRVFKMRHSSWQNFCTREVDREWMSSKDSIAPIGELWKENWDKYDAFEPKDIFKVDDVNFKRLCFEYLKPGDLMKHLGAEKVKFEHINMDYFKYDPETLEKVPFKRRNEYVTYQMEASKLDPEMEGYIYAVKCWCSSTDEEHWLWIDEMYKNDPLEAIASTFMVHEDVVPYITALKRQGDIMLVETSKQITPSENSKEVRLTKEQYFELLVCES